ncbi:MAG TPA: DUF6062 family protein [Acidobacteriota bacterium]|jgi:hypothetical protein|nr:DUF6062 family protein [Acidobacteriota bacterium]
MSHDITYLHIKRAIEKGTECFLCTLEDKIERKYIDTHLSELVMDPSSRQKIIENRGFCNNHFYKMLIVASKPASYDFQGMALIMKSITEKLIQDLCKQEDYRLMLSNGNTCPACVHLADFMESYVKHVVKLLSSGHEEFSKLFVESKGLCVPHFVSLMCVAEENADARVPDLMEIITKVEEKNFQRLDLGLAEYIKRQSYEFSDKDREKVEDMVLRGVEKIAGRRGVKLSISGGNKARNV